MKEYEKPELEYVEFITEVIATGNLGGEGNGTWSDGGDGPADGGWG